MTKQEFLLPRIIKIQAWFRGSIFRLKRLPLVMYFIQKVLSSRTIEFSTAAKDGRINSILDEEKIIALLCEKFPGKIKIPKIRMWYDICVLDYAFSWIPVNIKTTTGLTSDNTGNLAMCVYAYTDEELDLSKSYNNGKMSQVLVQKLKEKHYNYRHKKDYYFLVINKLNCDVIVNSVKGLVNLTANSNNLPFQVCWDKNRNFCYGKIRQKIKLFIECIQKPKKSWKEEFIQNMNTFQANSS